LIQIKDGECARQYHLIDILFLLTISHLFSYDQLNLLPCPGSNMYWLQ
jgi:hypothetical protein